MSGNGGLPADGLARSVLNMFTERVQQTRADQREQTRRDVLAAAQTLFRRDGFRSTTVRAIAAEADVSVGTVMGVGDKDALLLACYDLWIAERHAEAEADLDTDAELTVPQRIGETIASFVALFGDDEELAREYGAILMRGAHRTEVFASLEVALNDAFAQVYVDAGLGERAASAGRATYFAYLGLLMATSATGTEMAAIRTRLEDVAAVILGSES